jgi:hypothetical protein
LLDACFRACRCRRGPVRILHTSSVATLAASAYEKCGLALLAAAAMAAAAAAAAGCSAGSPSGIPAAGTAGPTLSPSADSALIDWRRRLPGGEAAAGAAARGHAGRRTSRVDMRHSPEGSPGGSQPAAAPAAARQPVRPGERVSIDLGGLWLGPENGARARYLFTRRQRADELASFARAYAPFRQFDSDGELVFRGRGAAAPGASERRMIAEWTRRVVAEVGGDLQREPAWPREAAPAYLQGEPPACAGCPSPTLAGRPIYPGGAAGGGPSPFGLAFAWHRGAATGGVCDDLTVYLSGEVRAGSCGAGPQVEGRLSGERLERLYAWVDGLEPFQAAGEQEVRADALIERLVFAGSGRRRASPEDIAAIESLAGSLHHELLAAAAAPSGSAPGVAAGSTAKLQPPGSAPSAAGEDRPARAAAPAAPAARPSQEPSAGPAEPGAEESSTDMESPAARAAPTPPTPAAPAAPTAPAPLKPPSPSPVEPAAPPPPPPPPLGGGGRR